MKNKNELTDIGGKCGNCGADDKWLILDTYKVPGTQYDYHYQLECQNELREDPIDEMGIGEIVPCKHRRDITLCEEPEYNPEDAPGFFDD